MQSIFLGFFFVCFFFRRSLYLFISLYNTDHKKNTQETGQEKYKTINNKNERRKKTTQGRRLEIQTHKKNETKKQQTYTLRFRQFTLKFKPIKRHCNTR